MPRVKKIVLPTLAETVVEALYATDSMPQNRALSEKLEELVRMELRATHLSYHGCTTWAHEITQEMRDRGVKCGDPCDVCKESVDIQVARIEAALRELIP